MQVCPGGLFSIVLYDITYTDLNSRELANLYGYQTQRISLHLFFIFVGICSVGKVWSKFADGKFEPDQVHD